MKTRILLAALALMAVLAAVVVVGYTPEQDSLNGSILPLRWPTVSGQPTLTWQVNTSTGPNVDTSGGSVQSALTAAFSAWTSAQVNLQTISTLAVSEGPNGGPNDEDTTDCLNVVSFEPTSKTQFSTGVIAQTFVGWVTTPPPTSYTCSGGKQISVTVPLQIVDADMVFSTAACFSTGSPAPTPSCPQYYDVQSIATHEAGHMLGLDHSGIAHAVMYPFGDAGTSQQKVPATDDRVGMAFLYPCTSISPPCTETFAAATGTVSGTVTLTGKGAFASHVVLLDSPTGIAVMDGLTHPDGTFQLVGAPQL